MAAKPRLPVVRSVKAPESLAALRAWLTSFDEDTRDRGDHYFREDHVAHLRVAADHYLEADVHGQSLYNVTLFLTRGQWTSTCTCPVRVNCKHAYATGLAWLATASAPDAPIVPAPTDPHLPLPSAPPAPAPILLPPPARGAPKKISFREQWSPVLAGKLGRPLTADEDLLLGRLSGLFNDFKAHWSRLHVSALAHHGFTTPAMSGRLPYETVYDTWWAPHHPPADPWALWQFLACDLERANQPLPEALRPLTDTTALHDRLDAKLLAEETQRWRTALAAPTAADADLREPAVAALRLRLSADGWSLETQPAPGKPFKAPTKKWLRALGTGVRAADFAHLPAPQGMLGALLLAEASEAVDLEGELDLDPVVAAVLATPAAHEAITLPDGSPWRVEPAPLAWLAVVDAAPPKQLKFSLVGPAGEDASDALALGPPDNPHFLWRGRVHRGPAALPAKAMPLRVLHDGEILTRLRRRGVQLPTTLDSLVRRVVLRPRLECRLEGDEGRQLVVRLLAVAETPPCAQELAPHGWQWAAGSAPPPRRADDPHFEFDLAEAELVRTRLADFKLGWLYHHQAWGRWVTQKFPEEFLAWRASLPPGLDIVAGPELSGLLAPPVAATISLDLTPASDGRDWFDLRVAVHVKDATLTPDEIALLLKARGKWVRLARLGYRRLDLDTGGATPETLARLGLETRDVLDTAKPATHRLHALQLAAEADALANAKLSAALRARAAALTVVAPELPAGLRATLRPYQLEGFQFLAFLSANGFGGILADDMGLGKTVQTLAWLLHLAEAADKKAPAAVLSAALAGKKSARRFRALIICPKSVVHGWLAETARFTPTLTITALEARSRVPAHGQLVVANYTQLRLQADALAAESWDAVVLDEGQFIKNPTSQAAAAARALPAKHRVVLTGTPVENRLLDLWSLFAFAQPGLLGSQASFRRQHRDDDPAALARLRVRTRHFLLRRTKNQVATDLPPRTEDEIVVDLEGEQRRLYDAELKRARAQLLGVETTRQLDTVRFHVLASLMRLRQICCHPALVSPAHTELPSAKLDALLENLEELRDEGHQVLVFSQFVQMLELIRPRLEAAGIPHLMLTGETENRAELVEKFQNDRSQTVFLLSLRAAGFGLNLTAASYVILCDPWWNPAVEAQAIDRTHRIGQTRPVMAYRLIARGTVEEKIRALQREKATMAAAVVQEESLSSVLDLDSLRRILE